MLEMWIRPLDQEDSLEKEMPTHSSIKPRNFHGQRSLIGYSPWNSPGQNTGVGGFSLLQGKFPTQGWNPGFLHCRWILYQLSHKESLRGHEFEQNPGDRVGQGRLVSCVHGVTKSQTWLSDWTATKILYVKYISILGFKNTMFFDFLHFNEMVCGCFINYS